MNDLNDLLLNRRTIRKYSPEPIGDNLLNELLMDGCRSSTTGNMQVYSIIVTRDENKKRELSPLHFNQSMVMEAPVLLTFCADFNRFTRWCQMRNAKPGYDNFLSFITAAIDALLVAQTVCIAAEARGLGICYLGTTTYMADNIIGVLHLPKGVIPVTTITMGWPAESLMLLYTGKSILTIQMGILTDYMQKKRRGLTRSSLSGRIIKQLLPRSSLM